MNYMDPKITTATDYVSLNKYMPSENIDYQDPVNSVKVSQSCKNMERHLRRVFDQEHYLTSEPESKKQPQA